VRRFLSKNTNQSTIDQKLVHININCRFFNKKTQECTIKKYYIIHILLILIYWLWRLWTKVKAYSRFFWSTGLNGRGMCSTSTFLRLVSHLFRQSSGTAPVTNNIVRVCRSDDMAEVTIGAKYRPSTPVAGMRLNALAR